MKKVELVSPAGNLEKLRVAFLYGADAVYLGGKIFNLRNRAHNFSYNELEEAVNIASKLDKKIYLTINIYFFNNDFRLLKNYLTTIYDIGIRELIISDLGALYFIKENFRNKFSISISTQANVTNFYTALFLKSLGVKRIISARELSLRDIILLKRNSGIEIETFIHGAMCVAYSGRCLLSEYLTNRNANRGFCSQPCRWNYEIFNKEKMSEPMPVEEDENGTYILSSKDLCTIEFIDKLIEAGIDSFKIEGRMKSMYYVANTTRVYRYAIDSYYDKRKIDMNFLKEELDSVSHRPYFPGFYFGYFKKNSINYEDEYIRKYRFIGYIEKNIKNDIYKIIFKDKLETKDNIEIILPDMNNIQIKKFEILDSNFEKVKKGVINKEFYIKLPEKKIPEFSIIRKKV